MSFVYGIELAASDSAQTLLDELDDIGVNVNNEYGGVITVGDSGIVVSQEELGKYRIESVDDLYPLGEIDETEEVYRVDDSATHLFDQEEYQLEGRVPLNPKTGLEINLD